MTRVNSSVETSTTVSSRAVGYAGIDEQKIERPPFKMLTQRIDLRRHIDVNGGNLELAIRLRHQVVQWGSSRTSRSCQNTPASVQVFLGQSQAKTARCTNDQGSLLGATMIHCWGILWNKSRSGRINHRSHLHLLSQTCDLRYSR